MSVQESVGPGSATAYDPFALAYSRTMAEDFCRRALPVLRSLLLDRLPPGGRILDVCCGAGQIARELSHLGFAVTGIDASEQMIRLARQNAPEAQFLVADARRFALRTTFDAAMSTFNSMAHVSHTRELVNIFTCVKQALAPGAKFVFDVTMEEGYLSRWHGTFSDEQPDLRWSVRPTYDPATKIARNEITVFRPADHSTNGDGRDAWVRSDFTIFQKCHSQPELEHALREAGFRDVSSFDAERDLAMTGENGRRFFVCR